MVKASLVPNRVGQNCNGRPKTEWPAKKCKLSGAWERNPDSRFWLSVYHRFWQLNSDFILNTVESNITVTDKRGVLWKTTATVLLLVLLLEGTNRIIKLTIQYNCHFQDQQKTHGLRKIAVGWVIQKVARLHHSLPRFFSSFNIKLLCRLSIFSHFPHSIAKSGSVTILMKLQCRKNGDIH